MVTEQAARTWQELFPFPEHAADVGGLRMSYIDEGSGPPVVMVHGNPTWSFLWRRLIDDLRSDHRTIAPDHIGMGRSDKPSDDRYPFTLERRIDDLRAFLDQLTVGEPITLVVHDWGGAIALGWAIDHPDEVKRIVVTNSAAFHLPAGRRMPPALSAVRSGRLGNLAVLRANTFVRGATRWGTVHPMSRAVKSGFLAPYGSPAHRLAVLRFVHDIPLRASHQSHATIDRIAEGLARLEHIPMLICWGARDFVFDDHFLAEWRARFPDAEVHRFADAGHLVMEDAAEQVIPLVRSFLT